MTAASILRLAASHGLTAQDQDGGEGLAVLLCRKHGWEVGDIVPAKYQREPFPCPWCAGELAPESAPNVRGKKKTAA